MAEVPVTISGVLYDKLDRTAKPVTLVGELSRTDVGIGGGPIVPPGGGEPPIIWGPPGPWPTPPIHLPPGGGEPPVIPGLKPEHPIVLPPNTPSHPIVIPPDNPEEPPDLIIWPPLPNNDLPKPEPPPIGGCHRLVYSFRYGWALVQVPKKK